MEQNRTPKVKKNKKIKNKRHWMHSLLVFLVCLLVAFVTWLVVMYTKQNGQTDTPAEPLTAQASLADGIFDGEKL